MELSIANEGLYFEKARIKKTDCELKDSDEIFFAYFYARGITVTTLTKTTISHSEVIITEAFTHSFNLSNGLSQISRY